jgi:hypothetical protein
MNYGRINWKMTYQKSLQKLDTLYIFKNNSHYLRFKILDSIDYSVEFT